MVSAENIKNLPASPGVYIFENNEGYPLYIGKSINIKERVKSHIYSGKRDPKEHKIVQSSQKISFIQTAGELGALLRESVLVKQLSPLYNRKLRRYRTLAGLRSFTNPDGYLQFEIKEMDADISPEGIAQFIHISKSPREIKNSLEYLRKKYQLCPKLLSLEKCKNGCFQNMLKQCAGACLAKEDFSTYNSRVNEALQELQITKWPFDGEIIVREEQDGLEEEIKVNNWCVVEAPFLQSEYEESYLIKDKKFDLDTYRIIRSHIFKTMRDYTQLF